MKAAPRPCSIADTLALVGEKYSLLVLREIGLRAPAPVTAPEPESELEPETAVGAGR